MLIYKLSDDRKKGIISARPTPFSEKKERGMTFFREEINGEDNLYGSDFSGWIF